MADPNSPLGFDMKYGADMDLGGRSCSGAELVSDAILHRITTGVLPLIESDNDYIEFGEDVRLWVGEALTQDALDARAAGLGVIIERDDRVRAAEVTGRFTETAGSLWAFELDIVATLRTGETIASTYGISAVTVEKLSGGR